MIGRKLNGHGIRNDLEYFLSRRYTAKPETLEAVRYVEWNLEALIEWAFWDVTT